MFHFRMLYSFQLQQVVDYEPRVVLSERGEEGRDEGRGEGRDEEGRGGLRKGEKGWTAGCHSVRKDLGSHVKGPD